MTEDERREIAFSVALDILRVVLKYQNTSAFLVYAHKNEASQKDASQATAVQLIEWLNRIGCNLQSDRSPKGADKGLFFCRSVENQSVHDILENQMCLLPPHLHSESVENVLLCGSELLEEYVKTPFYQQYLNKLERVFEIAQSDLRLAKSKLREAVESVLDETTFHHVLTEVALLELLRSPWSQPQAPTSIIPIVLNGDPREVFPPDIFPPTTIKIKYAEKARKGNQHGNFFKLLRRLFENQEFLLKEIQNTYQQCIHQPAQNPLTYKVSVVHEFHRAVTQSRREDLEGLSFEQFLLKLQYSSDEVKKALQDHPSKEDIERRDRLEEHRLCHQALKPSASYEDQKDRNPERVPGTCQWVLKHPQYLKWCDTERDDLLWISADPGCGKSVLAKSLLDNELQSTNGHTAIYFFFKDNEEQDRVVIALCAILHQLFSQQPHLIAYAIPAWKNDGNRITTERRELWRILMSVTRDSDCPEVTVVLDALDECEEENRHWLIRSLADFYTDAISNQGEGQRQSRLKFLITSRPYQDIESDFKLYLDCLPTIWLQGEYENDLIHEEIDLVIPLRVRQLAARLQMKPSLKDRLEEALLQMKNRTYLWLHLAIDDFEVDYNSNLRPETASVRSLPLSVEEAYAKILGRVKGAKKTQLEKILTIVVGARRPLSVQEMSIALGIATSNHINTLADVKLDEDLVAKNISQWCGLFVFVNHSRIYLIHQTAKEFLLRVDETQSIGWKYCLEPSNVEREMVQICCSFLLLPEINPVAQSLNVRLRVFRLLNHDLNISNHVESFFEYSAEHWPNHLRDERLQSDVHDMLLPKILQIYENCDLWFPTFGTSVWKEKGVLTTKSLQEKLKECKSMLAAILGHTRILKLLIEKGGLSEIDQTDENGKTSLMWACKLGHKQVVRLLIDMGADVNAKSVREGTTLCVASRTGDMEVIKMLINAGADINGDFSGVPIQCASKGGHVEVVKALIEAGADVNAVGDIHGTALYAASENGHTEVVEVLVKAGADINISSEFGTTPLYAASMSGYQEVVKKLIEAGAKLDLRDEYGNTALHGTSEVGYVEVVGMLIKAGADVNATGGGYGTAIQAASKFGREKVVRMLIEAGADVNATGEEYGTAIYAASGQRRLEIVQILIEAGADIDAAGGKYGTALQAAQMYGHSDVVETLIRAGADVKASGR